jgi:hypothetical protein
VVWGTTIQGNAREILAEAEQTEDQAGESSALDEALEFLRSTLASGPVHAKELFREARDAGHAERTLKRAKQALGVLSIKGSMSGKWTWEMPPKGAKNGEECHTNCVAPFGDVGPLRTENPDSEVL